MSRREAGPPPTVDDLAAALRASGLAGEDVALAVAVSSPATGRLTWASGGGRLPDVDAGTPFYAASVTKQLVGVLTAQLVLAGQLDVGTPVNALVPGLPGWAAAVRVHHLLHHVSGLPDTGPVLDAAGVATHRAAGNADVVRGLGRLPGPDVPPGRVFAYSNVGYVLLAEVLAAVTGRSFPVLARERAFRPLALSGSRVGEVPAGTPAEVQPPRTVGDGGWWCGAADLLAWLEALDADVLGVSRLVQTPGRLDDGTPLDYGWGVTVRPSPAGAMFTHGGQWPGWTAKTVRCPATGTAVALLSTSDDAVLVSDAAVALHGWLGADPACRLPFSRVACSPQP